MHTSIRYNAPVGMVSYLWRERDGLAEIYLASKNPTPKSLKRGLAGKMNGYGGGIEDKDKGSLFVATRREVLEECGVIIEESGMEKMAEVLFVNPWGNYFCHFFLAKKFSGDPRPSQEMGIGKWFPFTLDSLPLENMMDSDRRILPNIIAGRKFRTTITHDSAMKVVGMGPVEYVEHF